MHSSRSMSLFALLIMVPLWLICHTEAASLQRDLQLEILPSPFPLAEDMRCDPVLELCGMYCDAKRVAGRRRYYVCCKPPLTAPGRRARTIGVPVGGHRPGRRGTWSHLRKWGYCPDGYLCTPNNGLPTGIHWTPRLGPPPAIDCVPSYLHPARQAKNNRRKPDEDGERDRDKDGAASAGMAAQKAADRVLYLFGQPLVRDETMESDDRSTWGGDLQLGLSRWPTAVVSDPAADHDRRDQASRTEVVETPPGNVRQ